MKISVAMAYYNGGTSNLSAQKYLKDLVRGNDE